ncbi:MAG: glycosyltransferase family 9 protein [Acidobacteria bacterium]|nr:MAG: glycosyltransferase family 9 protein [Acidobacteriota bacterium]
MTTPALRALRDSVPGRRITLLTSAGGAAITGMVPELDETVTYDAPWVKATGERADSRADLAMVERLRGGRFDAAVIFTVYSQNPLPAAMLCYLADIPLRLAHCHENPYRLLTTWVPDPEPAGLVRHEVRRQLDLVAAAGASTRNERLSLRVPPHAMSDVRGRLFAEGIDPHGRFVVIHPGASAPSRRYPPESFAAAARQLAAIARCPIVFTGSDGERELVEGIRREMGAASVSLAGRLSLQGMAALLALAPVLVSNNTGPVHMAAALGTPVVDLYGLTNPQHAPWQVPSRVLFHDVPCRYCYKSVCPQQHHGCLRGVSPDDVARAAMELLDRDWERDPAGDGQELPRLVVPEVLLPPPTTPLSGGQA